MILSIIKELREETSTNNKTEILSKHLMNSTFKRVLYLTYNKLIVFGIKKMHKVQEHTGEMELSQAMEELENIYSRKVTGGDALDFLKNLMSKLNANDSEVLALIIGRDIKAGVNVKLINKVFGKDFIPKVPYMGAKPYSKKDVEKLYQKSENKVYADLKMDGRYANVKVFSDKVEIESRQGKPNFFGQVFSPLYMLPHNIEKPFVLNGELIIKNESRYYSNGVISSLVSIGDKILSKKNVDKEKEKLQKEYGKTYEQLLDRLTLVVWDVITYDEYSRGYSHTPRYRRLRNLKQLKLPTNVEIVEHKLVRSFDDAQEYLREVLERGEEGLILKAFDGLWENKKPNYQIKLKLEMAVDLKIVGFKEGTKGTKYEGTLGAFICESSDGLVKTDPAGVDESTRDEVWANKDEYLGQIIEVKCNGLSRAKDGNYSLLHPAFIKFRDDKDGANTLEEIKAIMESADLL